MNTNTTITPTNGNTTTPNNGKITVSQNTDTTPNNTKVTLRDNPKITPSNGKITANNGANNATVTVLYTVQCKELGIFREFDDYPTAHTFATQLEQDYPTAHIEKAKVSLFFDDWGQV